MPKFEYHYQLSILLISSEHIQKLGERTVHYFELGNEVLPQDRRTPPRPKHLANRTKSVIKTQTASNTIGLSFARSHA